MFRTMLIVCVVVFTCRPAAAAIAYFASSAVADPIYSDDDNDHAVFARLFQGVPGTPLFGDPDGSDFDLEAGATLTIVGDGSVRLVGDLRSQVDPSYRARIDLTLQTRDEPGALGPKLGLQDGAYVGSGGPVDPAAWTYVDLVSGVLTGAGALDGASFDILQRPLDGGRSGQLGRGASSMNISDGFALWIFLAADPACVHALCDAVDGRMWRGDINLNLQVVPPPAAQVLFITGLVVLAVLRRRQA